MSTQNTITPEEMRIIATQIAVTAYAYNHEINIIKLAKEIYSFLMGVL